MHTNLDEHTIDFEGDRDLERPDRSVEPLVARISATDTLLI